MNNNEMARENNLNNIRIILNSHLDTITANQCLLLGECFEILGQEDFSVKDGRNIDNLIARGKFGVLLPY